MHCIIHSFYDCDMNYVQPSSRYISIIMYGLFCENINKVQMHSIIILLILTLPICSLNGIVRLRLGSHEDVSVFLEGSILLVFSVV